MKPCDCTERHVRRRVVLTGGPGAGKTAVLELIRLFFCEHVRTLPESAGIIFGGHFPRDGRLEIRQAAQRAIYHVQRELESTEDVDNSAVVLCDRGTVDGAAYWIGAGDLWSAVGTTREAELARYDTVIHMRTPTAARRLPTRESVARGVAGGGGGDRRSAGGGLVGSSALPAGAEFARLPHEGSARAAAVRDEVPECCRHHVKQILWERDDHEG